jgi:hypothetical protein
MHNTVAVVQVLRSNSLYAGNVTTGTVYIDQRTKGCSPSSVVAGLVSTGVLCGAVGYGLGCGVSYEQAMSNFF